MPLPTTRRDGRKANQIRPLAAEQGILNRADGSARFVQGNTSVLAAVYGPAPAKSARLERADGATVDVNFKPESGVPTPADAEREALLRRSLEEVVLRSRYPRAVVSVVIQVRGGVRAWVLPRRRRGRQCTAVELLFVGGKQSAPASIRDNGSTARQYSPIFERYIHAGAVSESALLCM